MLGGEGERVASFRDFSKTHDRSHHAAASTETHSNPLPRKNKNPRSPILLDHLNPFRKSRDVEIFNVGSYRSDVRTNGVARSRSAAGRHARSPSSEILRGQHTRPRS